MDGRSETNLIGVYPALADKVRDAADVLARQRTFLLVVSGLRTAAQQDALYAQGRTAPGHQVTNAKAGYSMHNYGLAVDVVPYLSGGSGRLNWDSDTPQFQVMVTVLEEEGLEWGGDWKHFPDRDHFQLGGLAASPTTKMVVDYGDGGVDALKAIWANVAAGKYTI